MARGDGSEEPGIRPIDVVEGGVELLLIDIRPLEERRSELGFLPGSCACPLEEGVPPDVDALREVMEGTETAVLYCMSGRRSGLVLRELRETFPRPITHLEGGLLRWRAEGFPTCGLGDPLEESAETPSEKAFRRALQACFVAEVVERSLSQPDGGDDVDPMGLLHRCYVEERVEPEHATLSELRRVIERMGLVSRRLGTSYATIAENTERMIAKLTI